MASIKEPRRTISPLVLSSSSSKCSPKTAWASILRNRQILVSSGTRSVRDNPQKTLKRQAVADGFFQPGIGQAIPLLKQQGLEHDQGRMAGAPLSGMIQGFQELPEGPPVNLAVDLGLKVTVRHPTLGLQVPQAHLPRLFSQYWQPPTHVYDRRLARYINMLNSFPLLLANSFFQDTFAEVSTWNKSE